MRIGVVSMRIYLVVNVSRIVQYKNQVGRQKKEEIKLIGVEGVKEWEVKRILNKQKVRGVVKYLVQWKGFTTEYDNWKREENLENTKELVVKLKRQMSIEVRREKKLDIAKEKDFRRGELLGKYMAKILYG